MADSFYTFFIPCWNHLLAENDVLENTYYIGENQQNGSVLDPSPFQNIPEARRIFQNRFRVSNVTVDSQ